MKPFCSKSFSSLLIPMMTKIDSIEAAKAIVKEVQERQTVSMFTSDFINVKFPPIVTNISTMERLKSRQNVPAGFIVNI